MLIWRGFGLAVPAITFVSLLLSELGVEDAFSDERYYQDHGWPKLLGFAVAAALVWALSDYLDKRPGRIVIDKQTREEVKIGRRHDLFFVPLRYWPAILLAAGVGFLISG